MSVSQPLEQAPGCPSGLEPAADAGVIDPAPFVRRTKDGAKALELSVYGAKCGGCISKIEGGLNALPGVETARLNLSTGKLAVAWRGEMIRPRDITQKISDLGYRAAPFDPHVAAQENDAEGLFLLRCLAVAGFAMANIMLLSVAVWAGAGGEMGDATRLMMHWISGMIAIPAAMFAGRPFFRSAWGALKKGQANMDVPISLAVFLSLGISVYETLNHGPDAYFDAAVMLLFFLLIGRFLDHRLRARAREAAQSLLALQATTASRLKNDGTLEAVSARDINPEDRILLSPGDRAPVNGVVEEGASEVDVSLVTGESAPAHMKAGDVLYSGVLNMSSRLIMRATARAEDSLIADLTRLIEAGEQGKSKYVRLADRAAALYVPVVHTLALATFVGWLVIGDASLRVAAMNAIAVLIITCPCALGLAAPAVQVVATGRLFKEGVLVKSGDALERLAEVDAFVFDKTGTLTLGRMRLSNREEISDETLMQAASLARASRHPLARAVVMAAGAGKLADDVHDMPGYGVEGVINGEKARFGRADWVGATSDADNAVSEAWFKLGDQAPVRFLFEDSLRAEAAETISALDHRGVVSEMLTGDRQAPAARIAKSAGLAAWRAELTPSDKIARLKELSDKGVKTAMVGDGLNDAPALAAAHASLSPGTAADASQAAADFVFQGDSLAPVLTAYDVAKQARRRVLENFAFAALYNVCAIPLAVFGFVTPLIAALAMSGSSVIVTLNALRMKTKKSAS
ncbi:heavy metal translocating P-type ATPase [Hyphococcus sp.]|uniref:heavy metal translocating P-type ATPase n=1 Tax=Hyphococcus sp. TaxID=2038636 RepID=UPI003D0BD7B8